MQSKIVKTTVTTNEPIAKVTFREDYSDGLKKTRWLDRDGNEQMIWVGESPSNKEAKDVNPNHDKINNGFILYSSIFAIVIISLIIKFA